MVFAETGHGWRSVPRCWAVEGVLGERIIWQKQKRHGVESLAEMLSNPGCFHGLSSFPELGGIVCCSCQQINIYISCSPIQRVQKPKEETTILDLRVCQHCCWFLLFLYAYKINVILDVTITTYESQFHLLFEDFRLWQNTSALVQVKLRRQHLWHNVGHRINFFD